ncbi:MAG TPA: queuosine precursor transporter [Clostridiales bacterium]|nr:queuosine precursor transporter [Clostridiales bacterium]
MGINELLLLISVLLIYGSVILFYRLFGNAGLYCLNAVVTITANIEVLLLVVAFGLEQTLGNVLFASTFLITDILSETAGKKAARRGVYIGIAASLFFLVISQTWMWYQPSVNSALSPALQEVFSHTPRMVLAGISVYIVVQLLDVQLYHVIWSLTERFSNSKKGFLWLRNNVATLISQLMNSILFNLAAFWGTYDLQTLISIISSTYLIYIFTTLLDTPFVYLARKLCKDVISA